MGWSFCYTRPFSFDHSQTTRRRDHQPPRSAKRTSLRQRSCFSFQDVTWNLQCIHNVSTTDYHPQTDGLVECFHRTLTSMLSKTTQPGGMEWDDRLPYILFAYHCSEQESIQESPFFMVYGRDPVLPTYEALSKPAHHCYHDADDYYSAWGTL